MCQLEIESDSAPRGLCLPACLKAIKNQLSFHLSAISRNYVATSIGRVTSGRLESIPNTDPEDRAHRTLGIVI